MQRTNDELVGQNEGLQVQIQHLQTRFDIFFMNKNLNAYSTTGNNIKYSNIWNAAAYVYDIRLNYTNISFNT